jgi:hypothetical protein
MSMFCCLGCLFKESVQVWGSLWFFITSLFFYGEGLLAHAKPPSWRTTPCRLSAAAHSIYLQLPSIAGGCPYICNLRTSHAAMKRGPTYHGHMLIKETKPLYMTS